MNAAVLEIGDNLNTFGLALLVLVPQIIPLILGKRAKAAAEAAASTAATTSDKVDKIADEFVKNDGSTLLDKIQSGQHELGDKVENNHRELSGKVDAVSARLAVVEQQIHEQKNEAP